MARLSQAPKRNCSIGFWRNNPAEVTWSGSPKDSPRAKDVQNAEKIWGPDLESLEYSKMIYVIHMIYNYTACIIKSPPVKWIMQVDWFGSLLILSIFAKNLRPSFLEKKSPGVLQLPPSKSAFVKRREFPGTFSLLAQKTTLSVGSIQLMILCPRLQRMCPCPA